VAATILPKLGEQDLAMICANNADRLVQDAGNVAARVSIQRTIAHALLSNGQYDDALAVIDYTVTNTPSRDDRPELLSAIGTLHLVGAMTSARTADREGARSHLVYAGTAAQRLGRDANFLWTAFGPTNVRIPESRSPPNSVTTSKLPASGQPSMPAACPPSGKSDTASKSPEHSTTDTTRPRRSNFSSKPNRSRRIKFTATS
jgi:hypothetical protein